MNVSMTQELSSQRELLEGGSKDDAAKPGTNGQEEGLDCKAYDPYRM